MSFNRNIEALKESLTFALRLTFLITIPATAGLIILREPIIRVLFMHGSFDSKSLALTTHALLFYAIGLVAFASAKIFAPAFFSMKDVRTPVYISVVAVVVNLVGCILLKDPLANGGIALAASISAFVNALLLLIIFHKRVGTLNYRLIFATLGRISTAVLVMGIPIYFINDKFHGFTDYTLIIQVLLLIGVIILAAVLYFGTLKIVKSSELKELVRLVRRKGRE